MKMYIDIIFIENFIINLILLSQTAWLAKQKTRKTRLCLASLIGSGYVCIMLIFKINIATFAIFKIVLSVLIIYVAFKPKTIKIYLKEIILFYLSNVIALGSIYLITNLFDLKLISNFQRIIAYVFGFTFCYIVKKYLWKIYCIEIKKTGYVYDVQFDIGNREYTYKAFIDTGNSLMINGLGVAFALRKNQTCNQLIQNEKVTIYANTIDGESLRDGYVIDNVKIKKKGKTYFEKMIVCFIDKLENNIGYDMLLGYGSLEKLGGIKI